jgi:hypothetical protein
MGDPLLTITSQTGAIDLVLTATTVRMQLVGKVLDEVNTELTSAANETQEPAWAARFVHFVTRSVGKLVSKSIEVPIADIASVEYADGGLVFHYVKKPLISFEIASAVEGKQQVPVLQTFAEADARAFVEQFAKAKAAQAR